MEDNNNLMPKEKQSVAPLVLGILGFSGLIIPLLGYIFSITGIVISNKDKKKPNSKYGKIGFVLSIIALALSIIVHIISAIVLFNAIH